jgi:hypothetical protein
MLLSCAFKHCWDGYRLLISSSKPFKACDMDGVATITSPTDCRRDPSGDFCERRLSGYQIEGGNARFGPGLILNDS